MRICFVCCVHLSYVHTCTDLGLQACVCACFAIWQLLVSKIKRRVCAAQGKEYHNSFWLHIWAPLKSMVGHRGKRAAIRAKLRHLRRRMLKEVLGPCAWHIPSFVSVCSSAFQSCEQGTNSASSCVFACALALSTFLSLLCLPFVCPSRGRIENVRLASHAHMS